MQRHPDFAEFERRGVHFRGAVEFMRPEWKSEAGFQLAMDAQPALMTSANSDIPAWLTTIVDPDIYKVIFAPNMGAEILGEVKKGSWLDDTAVFPYTESTGEVSSYGDYSNNGSTNVNANFPQRQAYLYQTFVQYGEREMERADLARLSWAAANQESAVTVLNKFQNLTYHYGVGGLQSYGLVNEPALSAALTPGPKANGGVQWIKNGAINATPNELYIDFQSLIIQLQAQTNGLVKDDDPMVFVMSPTVSVAMTAANTFNTKVRELILENFPKVRFVKDPLYGAASASNPQGVVAGNLVQLIVEKIEGREVGYCAFNEKLRSHRIIFEASSFKQKLTQGSWGAVIRLPIGFVQMIGV